VSNQSLVLRIKFSGENRHLRQARNVSTEYLQGSFPFVSIFSNLGINKQISEKQKATVSDHNLNFN
jgi:hypothetical protein